MIIARTNLASRGLRAATLVELMTSMAVFSILTLALVYIVIFGMREDQLVGSMLGANDAARLNYELLLSEIRSSKNVQIGSGYNTNFTPVTNGPAQGNTLQIIPSTNLNIFIYYYFETNAAQLCRIDNVNNNLVIVANYLTNQVSQWLTNGMIFQATDYTGTNILTVDPTNYNHNYVVKTLLQFSQYQYPLTLVGSNYLYNYYEMQFGATRRSP